MAQTGIRMSRISATFSDGSFFLSVRFFFFLVVCVRGGWRPARGSDQVAVHIDLEKWARVRGGGVMKG